MLCIFQPNKALNCKGVGLQQYGMGFRTENEVQTPDIYGAFQRFDPVFLYGYDICEKKLYIESFSFG